jgi:signal transduction histidine kinase
MPEAAVSERPRAASARFALRKLPWLPVREPAVVAQFALHGRPGRFLIGVALVLSVFAHPVVARATGVTLPEVALVWGVMAAWFMSAHRLFYERALTHNDAFYALVFGNVVVGSFVCLSVPVLGRAPLTPIWVGFTMAACTNGASEAEASLLLGLFHGVAPLATIPLFLWRGAALPGAAVGPVVCAVVSCYGYFFLARRGHLWRRARHERELAAAEQRLAASELERQRLSRDLHDSVGTALSLVSLYSALVEQDLHSPESARQLVATIRDAAKSGLDELRGVLHALPQKQAPLEELADGLALLGSRAAGAAGAELRVEVTEGRGQLVGGPQRVAVVRVFQEAIHNSLRHGKATRITARLAARAGQSITLDVTDDGQGFDATARTPGRGLIGMRERARELGGVAMIETTPSAGTHVRLEIPIATGRATA